MTRPAGGPSTIAAVARCRRAPASGRPSARRRAGSAATSSTASAPSAASPTTSMSSLCVEQAPEAGPHQCLVVRQHHPDRHAVSSTSTGSRAATRNPPPCGRGPASRDPPAAAARSRIPASPCPRRLAPDPTPSSTISTVDGVARVGERDVDGRRLGVLDDVGDRLLHDPIDRERHLRRDRRGVPAIPTAPSTPACSATAKTRARSGTSPASRSMPIAERNLVHGVACRAPDALQRGPRLGRLAVEDVVGEARLAH